MSRGFESHTLRLVGVGVTHTSADAGAPNRGVHHPREDPSEPDDQARKAWPSHRRPPRGAEVAASVRPDPEDPRRRARGRARLGRRCRRLRRIRPHRELHRTTRSSSRARQRFLPTSARSRAASTSCSRARMPARRRMPDTSANAARAPMPSGELNDVNMLVHISDNPRRVTVISFPRDLMIPIPSCTREDGSQTSAMSKQMLNSAYIVRRPQLRREDRVAAHRPRHPVRGEGHLGRRDRDHERDRRRRGVSRERHQGSATPASTGPPATARSPASRRCSSCAPATASATAATSAASRTSSSTCRGSRASS